MNAQVGTLVRGEAQRRVDMRVTLNITGSQLGFVSPLTVAYLQIGHWDVPTGGWDVSVPT